MHLVNEEDLPGADVAEDSGEIELFLQDRTRSLFEADVELG